MNTTLVIASYIDHNHQLQVATYGSLKSPQPIISSASSDAQNHHEIAFRVCPKVHFQTDTLSFSTKSTRSCSDADMLAHRIGTVDTPVSND
jgi:hypothetical protein